MEPNIVLEKSISKDTLFDLAEKSNMIRVRVDFSELG